MYTRNMVHMHACAYVTAFIAAAICHAYVSAYGKMLREVNEVFAICPQTFATSVTW